MHPLLSPITGIAFPLTETFETLMNCKGAIIQNQIVSLRDKEIPWTLGGFLLKRHKSPDTITLGVGHLEDDDIITSDISRTKPSVISSTAQSANPGQSKFSSYLPEVTSSDTVKVYYAACDDVVPLTRSKLWNEINGAPGVMDKYDVFYPQNSEYGVVSIYLINDGQEFRMLHLNSSESIAIPAFVKGNSPFCFTSYTKPVITSLIDCVPLVALCRMHPHCTYKWECCNDSDENSHPHQSTAIIMCSVTFSTVLGSVHFDISLIPTLTFMWQGHYHKYLRFELEPQRRQSGVVTVLLLNQVDMNYCIFLIILPPKFDSQQFFPEEILKATDNLNKSNEIGSGGYGNVFIARDLRSIGTMAAIKVLNSEGSDAIVKGAGASNLIENEIRALMKFRHPNILQIMGYCFSPTIKALIFRYVENGSLHSWIHTDRSCQLTWEQICLKFNEWL